METLKKKKGYHVKKKNTSTGVVNIEKSNPKEADLKEGNHSTPTAVEREEKHRPALPEEAFFRGDFLQKQEGVD